MEKQIEEMAKAISEVQNGGWKFLGDSYYTTDVLNEELTQHLYNAGYRKQSEPISCGHEKGGEWISVDDRLPEDQQMVLTIDTEGEMQVCFYETEWEGIFQQCHGLVKIYNITHWRPLPEAPKMKGGEE